MEKKITEVGNSYWGGNGAYQDIFDTLYSELVPDKGKSKTIHGELIRCANRLTYDYNNNGNCNVIEVETEYEEFGCHECHGTGEVEGYDDEDEDEDVTCDECGGSGVYEEEFDGEQSINPFYQEMVDFLHENLNNKGVVVSLEDFLTSNDTDYSFNDTEMKVYNNLMDEVMYQVLTTKNKDIK